MSIFPRFKLEFMKFTKTGKLMTPRNQPLNHGRWKPWASVLAVTAALFLLLVASLTTVCLVSCSKRRDPQSALEHVKQTYRHGDMASAETEAQEGYKEFHTLSPDWAWKFTLLKGSILNWRGRSDEVLKLFASEREPPIDRELNVRKKRLEFTAYTLLRKPEDAEQKIREAEDICATFSCPACGDLVSARAWSEMKRGHYSQAQGLYERALSSARSIRDPFLEAHRIIKS